jgi:hypothetical protein
MITLNNSPFVHELFSGFSRVVEPVRYSGTINPTLATIESRNTTELLIMNYSKSTRDAFVRQFGWSVKPAKEHQARCSKRAG